MHRRPRGRRWPVAHGLGQRAGEAGRPRPHRTRASARERGAPSAHPRTNRGVDRVASADTADARCAARPARQGHNSRWGSQRAEYFFHSRSPSSGWPSLLAALIQYGLLQAIQFLLGPREQFVQLGSGWARWESFPHGLVFALFVVNAALHFPGGRQLYRRSASCHCSINDFNSSGFMRDREYALAQLPTALCRRQSGGAQSR